MRLGGRMAAAIEVLSEITGQHRPAAAALKDWGKAHRFAGAGDRAAIGNLVYDGLRNRAFLAHCMGDGSARALVLGAARVIWRLEVDEISVAAAGKFGPGALSDGEHKALKTGNNAPCPAWVSGNFPQWLYSGLTEAFGDETMQQGQALARRAPVDLRVNTLKVPYDEAFAALGKFAPVRHGLAPDCVRLPVPEKAGRNAPVESDVAHGMGWIEVQDAGSQIAARLCAAGPGHKVADICAGAGGKTLALAAAMQNAGELYAHDRDVRRLRPIFERLSRAGVSNTRVIAADDPAGLAALHGNMDVCLADAPCSGSGSWRRKPDAKWRLKPKLLEQRMKEQAEVLDKGGLMTRPGGRLVYVTCSVLPQENGRQIAAFLARNAGFSVVPYGDVWREALPGEPPASADGSEHMLQLTPHNHDTDGFFIAVLQKHP